jgi:hypothetical protein
MNEIFADLISSLKECISLLSGIPAVKNNQRAADAVHKARAAIARAEERELT